MSNRANIILITIDCLRADHVSSLGYHRKITSNIDNLAKNGTLFSQAIANGPNTYCSFPSILTSTYVLMNSLGAEMNYPSKWVFLSKENPTIAEIIRKEGWTTAAFHSNPWISSFFGYNRGFDFFQDSLNEPLRKSYFLKETGAKDKFFGHIRNAISFLEIMKNNPRRGAADLNRKAISWLSTLDERKNFFLWLHYMDGHVPLVPPELTLMERMVAMRLYRRVQEYARASKKDLKKLIDLYDKSVRHIDQELGFLFDNLYRMGISYENTYIIITADHGEQFMEHGVFGHGLLYDEVLRIPLVIAGPKIDANKIINQQVDLLSISPTIVELMHVKKVKNFQGGSLVSLMQGAEKREEGVISEDLSGSFAFRTEEWKYIAKLTVEKKNELYDLSKDPREKENLVEEEVEKRKEFDLKIHSHIRHEEIVRRTALEKRAIRKRLKRLKYLRALK